VHWTVALPGLLLMAWSAAMLWCGWASAWWPTADGELLERWVREGRSAKSSQPYFPAQVRYRYAVGAASYTGRRRRFSALPDSFASATAAYDALAGLAPGGRVAVFYHPRLPRLAVVHPGVAPESLAPLAFGALLALAGLQG
jgi:Protein of unknown function (DUF3592)